MSSKELVVVEAKGEKRFAPVDVDVLDNLVNAQAAYIEALTKAFEHFEADVEASHPLDALECVLKATSKASGTLLTVVALQRM